MPGNATAPPPFPDSLCHRCAELSYVSAKSSLFLRCRALPAKYPPQPVRACPLFHPRPSAA